MGAFFLLPKCVKTWWAGHKICAEFTSLPELCFKCHCWRKMIYELSSFQDKLIVLCELMFSLCCGQFRRPRSEWHTRSARKATFLHSAFHLQFQSHRCNPAILFTWDNTHPVSGDTGQTPLDPILFTYLNWKTELY